VRSVDLASRALAWRFYLPKHCCGCFFKGQVAIAGIQNRIVDGSGAGKGSHVHVKDSRSTRMGGVEQEPGGRGEKPVRDRVRAERSLDALGEKKT